ncbi:MAG TPA: ABC transporter ATP-binding protein [Candidatus Azoamicus sp. OHIO1]
MIKIIGLSKKYKDGIFALNNISLSINNGEFFALLGKNGAGKSTVIGILTSLIVKTSGKVYVSDYDIDYDFVKIKSIIGLVPQEYNFNQFETVLDIVLNQAGYYGINRFLAFNRAEYLLSVFDLWDRRSSVSLSLSGGMKRRLMLARALMHNPKILILDEPTAGVDILSRRLIWSFLKNLNNDGVTIILTTHYLEEVENLCSGVAIINNGNILIRTTVNGLLKKISKKIFTLEVDSVSKFEQLSKTSNYKLSILDRNTVEIVLANEQSLNDLLKKLIDNNIFIYNINNKDNKLEELFINLVS